MTNDRFTSAPRRTGQADFPHPALLKALASGMHRFASELVKAPRAQVFVEGLAFGQSIGTLAAALQMPPQSHLKVTVDVPKRPAGVAQTEVVAPPFQMPVQIANQLSDRPEALFVTDHFPQVLPPPWQTAACSGSVLLKPKGVA